MKFLVYGSPVRNHRENKVPEARFGVFSLEVIEGISPQQPPDAYFSKKKKFEDPTHDGLELPLQIIKKMNPQEPPDAYFLQETGGFGAPAYLTNHSV